MKNTLHAVAITALILLTSASFITPVPAHAAEVINAWWPINGAHIAGTQPFKALVPSLDVSRYEMFWQVDGGSWNWMYSGYTDYPHKEAWVNVSGWSWRGAGPYTVTFIARQNGVIIAQYPVTIYIDNGLPVQSTPSANVTITPTPTAPAPSTDSPLAGFKLYVSPNSSAAQQAQQWQSSDPRGAGMMRYLAAQPTAVWIGEWNTNVSESVRAQMASARTIGSVPTFVIYAIPERDCRGYSSGGTNNPSAYAAWVANVASGIGSGNAIVILEPDALAQITCLSSADQATRLSLLANAVATLKRNAGTKVYIDAGHSGWIDAATMASRLTRADIAKADGFALNVSNFVATSNESAYGAAISAKTNNKHFVIDTSRNGNGSNGQWCNPPGRAVGSRPTTITGNALFDAYLWVKVPGESDGACNGGPSAGSWWPSYALGLVENAHIAGL